MLNLEQIQPGATAYDQDGESIGDIQDVGTDYVLVSKGFFFPTDIYIPVDAISRVDTETGGVSVDAQKASIETMGWNEPPAVGYADVATTTQEASWQAETAMTDQVSTTGDLSNNGDALRVPVVEEHLTARKQTEQAGEVVVGKDVVEERQTLQVPVTREEVTVNRVAVDRPLSAGEGVTTDGDTIRVPVTAEHVTVDKEARVVEEIEIQKQTVTENQTVDGTVRREEVHVEGAGARNTSR